MSAPLVQRASAELEAAATALGIKKDHPLIAVGAGVLVGLILARLVRR